MLRSGTLVLSLWLSLFTTARADAYGPVDVAQELDGLVLGDRVAVLEDRTGALTIGDMAKAARGFRASATKHPAFGFTKSVYWLRLPVRNRAPSARRWLLEVAYPLLDSVTLYTPDAQGRYHASRTGDMRSFAQRELSYSNFLFERSEPAASEATYYLRISSSGSLSVPMRAWGERAFLHHQLLTWAAYCMFYGALLVMAGHALSVYLFLRQTSHLFYVGYLLSALAANAAIAGHVFQFLLPDHPLIAQRVILASTGATFAFAGLMVRNQMRRGDPGYVYLSTMIALSPVVVLAALLMPFQHGARLIQLTIALLLPSCSYFAWSMARRGTKEVTLFALSFLFPLIGVSAESLYLAGLLPNFALAGWSTQFGLFAQAVLISSSMADKLNVARDALIAVNAQYESKAQDLSIALQRAESATRSAERAALLRDQFMATISHEFRTPLNAIINVPQGLREEFAPAHKLVCSQCGAGFLLDQDEQAPSELGCPECQSGLLSDKLTLRFIGDAARASRLLRRVLRAGQGLLRTVNGVLEFSRIEAGQLELLRAPVSLAQLVTDSVERFSREQGRSAKIDVEGVPSALQVDVDDELVAGVLAHLLNNALKFSEGECEIRIAAEQRDGRCLVSVADRGIGIAEQDLERIFLDFEQASTGENRRYGGTGLGLCICRALVEAHGCEIWATSRLGSGSTFFFTLPLAQPSQVRSLASA